VRNWCLFGRQSVEFKATPVVATPDVEIVTLGDDDEFLIVASDGLWEVTTSAQAVTFVKRALTRDGVSEASLQKVAADLVKDAVVRRRTSDNVSCVIIALPGSASSSSTPSAAATAPKRGAPKRANPFALFFQNLGLSF